MKIAFSWDDGAVEDQKLFELHEKYEIPAIFFVPNRNIEGRSVISPLLIKNAESKFVSFGGHTLNHRYLTEIPIDEVKNEVYYNQKYLEDILGHSIEHFCLPGGKYNSRILNIVNDMYKTIRTADSMNFTLSNNYLIKPTFHFYPRGIHSLLFNGIKHKSFEEMANIIKQLDVDYFSILKHIIEINEFQDKHIIIWGHSWELERNELWNELDEFLKFLSENYYTYCTSYDSLL